MKKFVLSILTIAMFSFVSTAQCDDPTLFEVDNITSSGADLTWVAGDDENEWELYWGVEANFDPTDDETYESAIVSEEMYTLTGLEAETEYTVALRALCDSEESGWVTLQFTTLEAICEDPTDLAASVTWNSATLTWTAGDEETEWEVLWGELDFDPTDETEVIGEATVEDDAEFTIEDLDAETTYDAYVRAVCGVDDESTWVKVTFTTEEETSEPDPVLWTDTFDDESAWTIENDGTSGDEYGWGIRDTPAGWTLPAINSTSGGNFAELSNGDPTVATGGTQEVGVTYTMTLAEGIDVVALGGSDQITLEFEQYGATFNDLQQVLISTNGVAFTPVFDNSDREPLTADGGDPYDNPELIRVNLAPFLTEAPEELYIQFLWTSAFPAETNPNAWVTYGWMIDDVRIVDNFDYDLEVLTSSWGTDGPAGLLSYPRVPNAQVGPIEFNADLRNSGKSEQTGVQFVLDVNSGETVDNTASISLESLEEQSVSLSYTPSANGTYSFNRSVTSDFIDEDGDPSNNQFSNISVIVNDYIYARDNGTVSGSISNGNDGTEIGNLYEIRQNATLTGLDLRLNGGANGTPAGTEVFIKLYRATEDFEFVAESQSITLASNQLNQFITIPFDEPIDLVAGEIYLPVVGSFDGGLVVSGAGSAPDQTVFLFDYASGDWFFVRTTAMVRMNFDPIVSTAEIEASLGNLNIYPNPTTENATIDFELVNDTDVEIVVTDLSGKVMTAQHLGRLNGGQQTTTVDASSFANGIYFVTIKTDNTKTTQKFIKK